MKYEALSPCSCWSSSHRERHVDESYQCVQTINSLVWSRKLSISGLFEPLPHFLFLLLLSAVTIQFAGFIKCKRHQLLHHEPTLVETETQEPKAKPFHSFTRLIPHLIPIFTKLNSYIALPTAVLKQTLQKFQRRRSFHPTQGLRSTQVSGPIIDSGPDSAQRVTSVPYEGFLAALRRQYIASKVGFYSVNNGPPPDTRPQSFDQRQPTVSIWAIKEAVCDSQARSHMFVSSLLIT